MTADIIPLLHDFDSLLWIDIMPI